MKETFYKGAHGNLSLLSVTTTLAALAAAASQVIADQLPIGTEVVGIRHISANLGATTGLDVKLVDANGDATTLLSIDTTAADFGSTPLKPVYIGDNGGSDLVLTNTGAASATGEVTIQLEYRFKGY